MTQALETLELARSAREVGFFAVLGAGGEGMASPGAVRVGGRDAIAFLHSQVTNEVEGLAPGEGNYSARVTLQGQLVEVFSVHRLPENSADELWLVLERERVPALMVELDSVLFADDVKLEDASGSYHWLTLQGAAAGAILDEACPRDAGTWSDSRSFAIEQAAGVAVPPGSLVISRSLGGDPGFIVAIPSDAPALSDLEARVRAAAQSAGCLVLEEPAVSRVVEVLRIEAGQLRMGPDTRGRKRVLPETGLEQYAVSYTKGCYLGQEVIARIRTYGSLPYGLRGLVFSPAEEAARVLEGLPEEGEALLLDDGTKVGQMGSRTQSPSTGSAVAFAYLDKAHRTPGTELQIRMGEGSAAASVVLLPFYSAPDRAGRVAWLYDRAVREFSAGRDGEAITLLEEVLRLDPSFTDGYEAIGVILGRSERFHEAIDIFKRLEEIAPDQPMVNTNLSLYFMKVGDRETAEAEAARAMQKEMAQKSGRSVDADSLDRVMAEEKQADAQRKKEMFAQVLEIDPDDPIALFGLGNALTVLAEWEEAAAAYGRAVNFDAGNSAVYLAHGKALEELGLNLEAEGVYRAGMEVASKKGDLMPLKEMEHRLLLSRAASSGTE